MTKTVIVSGLSLSNIHELGDHPKLKEHIHVRIHPKYHSSIGLQVRTMDGGLYDATLTFLAGGLSGVVFNLLSSWIYDKYKQNRVKKPMINGIEVDIENITPEEILAIFTKDQHVDPCEDSSE